MCKYGYIVSSKMLFTAMQRTFAMDRRGSILMKFDRVYLLFINLSARLFGAMAVLFGIVALISAYAFTADRWMYMVAGIFAIAVGVAAFMAKPITAEHISSIRRKMGRHGT